MEFLHISDLHYRICYPQADTGYTSIFKEMQPPLEQLKKGLEKIDRDRISFVIISGDLTEDGTAEDYWELKRNLDDIFGIIPYFVTIGNHDNKKEMMSVWYGKEGREGFGEVSHFNGIAIIMLDNSAEKNEDGIITQEHCVWLESKLREASWAGEKVILAMHHPLIFDRATPIPIVSYPEIFCRLMREYPPAAILCGHTHSALSGSFENTLYATAGSMSFRGFQEKNGKVCFREYASMNLCTIEEQYISIEEIPILQNGKILGRVQMNAQGYNR